MINFPIFINIQYFIKAESSSMICKKKPKHYRRITEMCRLKYVNFKLGVLIH